MRSSALLAERWTSVGRVPPDGSATLRCPSPGCRWPGCGWHISRPAPPAPRRSPGWRRQRRPETPPLCPASVGARSREAAVLPSYRHCGRCRAAALPPRKPLRPFTLTSISGLRPSGFTWGATKSWPTDEDPAAVASLPLTVPAQIEISQGTDALPWCPTKARLLFLL